MSLTLTKDLPPMNRPPVVSLEFVDDTARDAETYTSFDISRIAKLDDGTFWVLKSVGPDVWEEIFIAPGVGPTGATGPAGADGATGATGPTGATGTSWSPGDYGAQECFPIAISDTTTALATGTVPITFHFPYAFALTKIKAGVNTVSSSGLPTFDVKKNGTSVFTTKVTIDASENHSSTAATAAVLTSTPLSIASADAITFSIDVAGTGTKQATIYLIGYATGAG